MSESDEMLERYEALLALVREMEAHAVSRDWDRVAGLEKKCGSMMESLLDNRSSCEGDAGFERSRMRIMHEIFLADAGIRALAHPWMGRDAAMITGEFLPA